MNKRPLIFRFNYYLIFKLWFIYYILVLLTNFLSGTILFITLLILLVLFSMAKTMAYYREVSKDLSYDKKRSEL